LPKGDYEIGTTPSLLERLLDTEPASPHDPPGLGWHGVDQVRTAVQRDLEHLLNTRNAHHDISPDFAEAGQSVLTYGVTDFSALNVTSSSDQARLRLLVEQTIRTFEPRLAGVSVTVLPAARSERALRLRIDARLLVEPTPEPVIFDVVMPLATSKYEVSEGS
jgi:type VI secretion system protein ImpF